jgi:gliding motility-associated protein GldL
MASTKNSRQLYNLAYGLGASIVILGALFKILHWELGPLTGGTLLAIGLITEAIIFAIAAFEPTEDELDWTKVFPQLKGEGGAIENLSDIEGLLSKKLDKMLAEAKIDSEMMDKLGESIRGFEAAARGIAPTADAIRSTQKYAEELDKAASQMESLNQLYQGQLDSAKSQADTQAVIAANTQALQEQMATLSKNLESLNQVYDGMLNAMQRK